MYAKNIIEQANNELLNNNSMPAYTSNNSNSFKDSLKVNPTDLLPNKKSITISNNFNNVIDLYR